MNSVFRYVRQDSSSKKLRRPNRTCLRMKYKHRIIIVIFVAIFTVIVTSLIAQDLVEVEEDYGIGQSKKRYYDTALGSLQGRIEDALGLRKVVINPDLSLQKLGDFEAQMKRDKNGDASDNDHVMTLTNSSVWFDEAVERMLELLEADPLYNFSKKAIRQLVFKDYVLNQGKQRRLNAPRLPVFAQKPPRSDSTNHYRFFYGIRQFSMYDPEDPAINDLLRDMANLKITRAEMMKRGTELKLVMEFENNHFAVFKPMRWSRDYETLPNHFYFNDFERHHSEIAAFHLDRVIGFYRVPPVTGRLVNMTKEIFLITEKALKKTFYVSPIGNICFYGECTYYCDSRHSFCGNVDMIEGSLMVFLPTHLAKFARWRSPYRRSYSKFSRAKWEKNENFCTDIVKKDPNYDHTKLLLDLIDTAVFDFLTGNMDRHHTEVWEEFGNTSFPLHMDNGRGFGKSKVDEFSILAPLTQCCVIRESTFIKLVKLYMGPDRLSYLLNESLKRDPLYPILADKYLVALDRRVVIILRTVYSCVLQSKKTTDVIANDHM